MKKKLFKHYYFYSIGMFFIMCCLNFIRYESASIPVFIFTLLYAMLNLSDFTVCKYRIPGYVTNWYTLKPFITQVGLHFAPRAKPVLPKVYNL